jgi:hypothetical protein
MRAWLLMLALWLGVLLTAASVAAADPLEEAGALNQKATEPRAEALRLARQAIKAKYPQPFFWGSLPCTARGEARELP